MQITSYRVRGDDKIVLNGDNGRTYHFLNAENAVKWMTANTTNLPTLTSISPTTAPGGSLDGEDAPDVTVTLTGTHFTPASEVLVNGAVHAKTYVSATSMTILLATSLVTPPVTLHISARNGLVETVSKPFAVTVMEPTP